VREEGKKTQRGGKRVYQEVSIYRARIAKTDFVDEGGKGTPWKKCINTVQGVKKKMSHDRTYEDQGGEKIIAGWVCRFHKSKGSVERDCEKSNFCQDYGRSSNKQEKVDFRGLAEVRWGGYRKGQS